MSGSASRSEDGVAVRFRGSSRRLLPSRHLHRRVRVDGDRDEAMKKVEPDQIDRIEVYGTRVHGSEAENGVIQIFTKSPRYLRKRKTAADADRRRGPRSCLRNRRRDRGQPRRQLWDSA